MIIFFLCTFWSFSWNFGSESFCTSFWKCSIFVATQLMARIIPCSWWADHIHSVVSLILLGSYLLTIFIFVLLLHYCCSCYNWLNNPFWINSFVNVQYTCTFPIWAMKCLLCVLLKSLWQYSINSWVNSIDPLLLDHKRDAARAEDALVLSYGSELIGMQRDWNEELQSCREFPHTTPQERYKFLMDLSSFSFCQLWLICITVHI